MLFNVDRTGAGGAGGAGAGGAIGALIKKAEIAGGVVVEAFTRDNTAPDTVAPDGSAAPDGSTVAESGFDTLVLHSATADVFDSVDELASGLESLGIDRLIMLGDARVIEATAQAAVVLSFDVVVVRDCVYETEAVTGAELADGSTFGARLEQWGISCVNSADVWLRM